MKKVMIVYSDSNLRSQAVKEKKHIELYNELRRESEKISSKSPDVRRNALCSTITFPNGSELITVPFSQIHKVKDFKITHLYIDIALLNVANLNNVINNLFVPMLTLPKTHSFDADGEPLKRIYYYG